MHPFVNSGQSCDANPADLMALDAIGWNLATPAPEPRTYALLGSLAAIGGWMRSRRRRG